MDAVPPTHALLLRACLLSGDEARSAFAAWSHAVGEPRPALAEAELKRAAFLPLLLRAVDRDDLPVDRATLSVLRASRAHEELRADAVRTAVRDVLTAGNANVMLTGGVVAATVYPEWPLRHCHDVDLLVAAAPGSTTHASGLPVVRHACVYPARRGRGLAAAVRERAVRAEVAGASALVPAPADAFVHVLGRAALGVTSLRWVVDAWFLALAGGLDPAVAADHARASGLSRPIANRAAWLVRELSAPLPEDVLGALTAATPRRRRLRLRARR
jgi:hypothetical protein